MLTTYRRASGSISCWASSLKPCGETAAHFTSLITPPLVPPWRRDKRIDKAWQQPSDTDRPTFEKSCIQTFGRLATWSSCLENDSLVNVLVRHCEGREIKVQASLISHVSDQRRAGTVIRWPDPIDAKSPGVLDLRPFETSASMILLFWLYNRRLPRLRADCQPIQTHPTQVNLRSDGDRDEPRQTSDRKAKEVYSCGLVEAWRLGSAIAAPKFMNDILRHLATILELEEVLAQRSSDPEYSAAIAWARRAYDTTAQVADSQMREFAVDVAAKRVFDVGTNGYTLSPEDRSSLSGNARFSADVFASLGGQIGTSGVDVRDIAKGYVLRESFVPETRQGGTASYESNTEPQGRTMSSERR